MGLVDANIAAQAGILWPALVVVVLTYAVLIVLGVRRGKSLAEQNSSMGDPEIALGRARWSDEALKANNNYNNLLQLPVLFYAVIAIALALRMADGWMTGLAWIYAASRLIHSFEHLGANRIRVRGPAFLVGALALLVMWLTLAWRIL